MGILSAIPLDITAGIDIASMVFNASSFTLPNMDRMTANIEFGQPQKCNSSSSMTNRCVVDMPDVANNINSGPRSINFNLQGTLSDDWRMTLPWESLPCTTEVSTNFQSTKCYT